VNARRVRLNAPEGHASWNGGPCLENGELGWTTMEPAAPGSRFDNVWVTFDSNPGQRLGTRPAHLEEVMTKKRIGDVLFETRPVGARTFLRAETPSGDHLLDVPAGELLELLEPGHERENDLQRARREGFVRGIAAAEERSKAIADGAILDLTVQPGHWERAAAAVFPTQRRILRSAVVSNVKMAAEGDGRVRIEWPPMLNREPGEVIRLTPEMMDAIASLRATPFTMVKDDQPESS
jgi:hypothetical protein